MSGLLIWMSLTLQAQTLMDRANAARDAQRLDEAIGLYQQIVKAEPANAEALWYLGLGLYEKDRYAEAAPAFRKLTAIHPKQGAGWAMLGLCEYRNKRYDSALTALRRARALGVPPMNDLEKVSRYHLAVLLNHAGEFELSSSILMTFVADNAVTPQITEAAGVSALRLRVLPGETPDAMKEPVDWAGKASILAWQKRTSEAMSDATRLQERYPKLANVHYLMGYLRLLSNDPASIAEFEKELALDGNHVQARMQIAYEYLKRGEAEKGLPYAVRATALAPRDFIAHNIHGRILLDLNRAAEAAVALETAAKLAPSSPEAHFHLASAYTRLGRKADAARHRAIFAKLDQERKR